MRNSSRLLLTYGMNGALQLRVENRASLEQPSKPAWSNAVEVLNGGWPSYEFGDGSNGFSVSSPVVSGVAQFQLTGLSVGVHTVTAGYSGDVNTLSSQTKGSLNIAVTGQAGLTIRANTGGLFHEVGVNFTLQ